MSVVKDARESEANWNSWSEKSAAARGGRPQWVSGRHAPVAGGSCALPAVWNRAPQGPRLLSAVCCKHQRARSQAPRIQAAGDV